MGVHHQLGQPQDFTTQVESVAEPGLLSLFGGECLDGFQIEVVIKMEIIQVLAMDQKVQHVVTLTTDLKTHFYPVQCGRLEELGGLEGPEQVALLLSFGWAVFESVEHVVLQQLLV